ncbi:ATP-binding protein [Pseudooceanicola sp. HF7]|uniref:hybrid sensor histidine kinase/response regulator n=1 Tax=Pseudooceanicola sp. HF7 TaxID=2721560 RepID=UPI001430878F|nr:ATP-binding protein [Pseudooceanicola sp. HF7]NIZ08437.1 response regulator [Pseudooceanicola sp. HF7]
MSLTDDPTERVRLWTRTGAAILVLVFCTGLVGGMALVVLREINSIGSSTSDNLQWSLAQADVEFMQFRLALERAEEDPAALSELRPRFDIFYSRIDTLERGDVYQTLRDTPDFQVSRDRINEFLEETVPYIDGTDQGLLAALPELEEAADQVMSDVRRVTLSGLRTFSNQSVAQRKEVIGTLLRLAAVLAVVLAGLMLLALALWRLNRLASLREAEVKRTAGRMRTIVETSLDAIVLSDAQGRIREFNSSAQRIFGYSRDEARQADMLDLLFPPASREKIVKSSNLYFQSSRRDSRTDPRGQEHTIEVQAMARGGRSFPAEMSFDRADGDDGPVYVAYIRDISRRKAAEDGLTEARDRALAGERAKAEFLAVMSHEMRTPLNGLLGTMQLLRDHDLSPAEAELLARMHSSGRLLLGLVNDVLDLAKYEAGKLVAERRPMSVSRLMDGVVATMAALAAEQGNSLTWTWLGREVDAIQGDPRRLRQVLLNLVGNAVKFTRDGSVEIEVEVVGFRNPELEIRVADTGIGIQARDLDRIFNDFETLDSSYARQAGGTGLGLGIAKRLAGLMGGAMGAESEPGEGSLFWLRLPLEKADPASVIDGLERTEEELDAAWRRRGQLSVLLVEDNEINRFVARQMLEAAGHKVTEAADGAAGVEKAEQESFDAILMDISMPVMDGQEAARRIRTGGGPCAETPILAVTAHALPEEVARFRDAGMVRCISKPLHRAELLEALAEITLPPSRNAAATVVPLRPDAAEGPPSELIDRAFLDRLWQDLPEPALEDLLERFLKDMGKDMGWFAEQTPESPDLRRRAHKAAGSCGVFGLLALRRKLGDIELAEKSGQTPRQEQIDQLPDLWSRSRAALLEWCALARQSD